MPQQFDCQSTWVPSKSRGLVPCRDFPELSPWSLKSCKHQWRNCSTAQTMTDNYMAGAIWCDARKHFQTRSGAWTHTQKWNIKYHHGPPVTSSKCSWQPRFFSNRIDLPPNLWKIHPALPYLLWMLPLTTKENGLQMFAWLDCAGASRSLLQLAWEQASI